MRPVYAKSVDTRLAGAERRIRFLERREQIPNPHLEGDTGGSGIQFDTYPQAGEWLYVETDGAGTSPSGFGVEIFDDSGNGINLGAASGGNIELKAIGGGSTIIRSTNHVDVHDENTTPGGAGVDIQSLRSDVTIRTGHYFTGLVGYLILTGLPTSDPGVTGAVWNDSGTLKISP